MSRREEATRLFEEGYNCAQAILAAYGGHYGLDRGTAFRMAMPLGGGLAETGGLCGALSGAILVIGLRYGSEKPPGLLSKRGMNSRARAFMDRFAKVQGAIGCKEIRDSIKIEHGSLKRTPHCTGVVDIAASILEDVL
jgi:C_GCAxxG_C_C family probable redox protein